MNFEGPVIGPSVDHAFVVVDPAPEVDAHVNADLSLGLGLWRGGRSGSGVGWGRGLHGNRSSNSLFQSFCLALLGVSTCRAFRISEALDHFFMSKKATALNYLLMRGSVRGGIYMRDVILETNSLKNGHELIGKLAFLNLSKNTSVNSSSEE